MWGLEAFFSTQRHTPPAPPGAPVLVWETSRSTREAWALGGDQCGLIGSEVSGKPFLK